MKAFMIGIAALTMNAGGGLAIAQQVSAPVHCASSGYYANAWIEVISLKRGVGTSSIRLHPNSGGLFSASADYDGTKLVFTAGYGKYELTVGAQNLTGSFLDQSGYYQNGSEPNLSYSCDKLLSTVKAANAGSQ